MSTIINLIGLIFFVTTSWFILTPSMQRRRVVQSFENPAEYYYINPTMAFGIFILCTGPLLLGQFSLMKYGFYYLMLIYMMFSGKIQKVWTGPVIAYFIFLLWVILDGNYSNAKYDASMLIIKYSMPLFTLWLGYSSLQCTDDFVAMCKAIAKCCFWYGVIIGGVTCIVAPWFYFSPIGQMFHKYAGTANYFTAMTGVTLVLYTLTREKKWLLILGWMILSTVADSVRTGMGGMTLAISLFYLFRYKMKALPVAGLVFMLFIGAILFIPAVGEKFYGNKATSMTAGDLANNASLSKIQTNGRTAIWGEVLNKFYKPSQTIGSGTGTVTSYMKKIFSQRKQIGLLHSDYVQIRCDNGNIGILLIAIFYITILLTVFGEVWVANNEWVKLSGSLAVGSMAGIAFSMGFDNVVSHGMDSFIIPFFFLGLYYKMKVIHE